LRRQGGKQETVRARRAFIRSQLGAISYQKFARPALRAGLSVYVRAITKNAALRVSDS